MDERRELFWQIISGREPKLGQEYADLEGQINGSCREDGNLACSRGVVADILIVGEPVRRAPWQSTQTRHSVFFRLNGSFYFLLLHLLMLGKSICHEGRELYLSKE